MIVKMRAVLHFDGGCRPKNPGHAAFACVVKLDGEEHVIARYIGIKTNNEAEYMGLIVGVKFAASLGATELHIVSDSKLVVNQVSGRWKEKEHWKLKHMVREARALLSDRFDTNWDIVWVKRDHNVKADAYCTGAVNYGMNLNPFLSEKFKAKRPGEEIDPFASTRVPRRYGVTIQSILATIPD